MNGYAIGIGRWETGASSTSSAWDDPQGVPVISNQPRSRPQARTQADGTLVGARCGPTALRIALGVQLRRLRENSNITTAQAAEAIRATHSKISRLERGRSGARQRDVDDLLTLYGVTDEAERERVLALTRQANAPG